MAKFNNKHGKIAEKYLGLASGVKCVYSTGKSRNRRLYAVKKISSVNFKGQLEIYLLSHIILTLTIHLKMLLKKASDDLKNPFK